MDRVGRSSIYLKSTILPLAVVFAASIIPRIFFFPSPSATQAPIVYV